MSRITLDQAEQEFSHAVDFFKKELAKLRSGRANPELVADIKVEAYEQMMPVHQLANVNVADPTLLVIQPWDKSLISNIAKAIESSDIGIQPAIDGEIIRLPMPALTQERREEYTKILGKKTEEARVSIRQVRKDIMLWLDEEKEAGNLSEDEQKRKEKELQDKVDAANSRIEEVSKAKETELMQL